MSAVRTTISLKKQAFFKKRHLIQHQVSQLIKKTVTEVTINISLFYQNPKIPTHQA